MTKVKTRWYGLFSYSRLLSLLSESDGTFMLSAASMCRTKAMTGISSCVLVLIFVFL